MKFFLVILVVFITFIGLGVSGILFVLWPTSIPDQKLNVSDYEINALSDLRQQIKFKEDLVHPYPGATNEVESLKLETLVNFVLDDLVSNLKQNPKKSYVLSLFKKALKIAIHYDSEDRDMILIYFMQIMDILKIQSSNELLNVWRYGWFLQASAKAN